MKDIVEAALARAGAADREAADAVDGGDFEPVQIAVVGVEGRGRDRLDDLRAAVGDWDHGGDQVRTGLAPVDSPEGPLVRSYPGGRDALDVDGVDLLLATGHVHSGADVRRLRSVATAAPPEAATVAVPTLAEGVAWSTTAVASDLSGPYDAVAPVEADLVAALAGDVLGDVDERASDVDDASTALCLALCGPHPVGAHQSLTPNVTVLPLLAAGGRVRAFVGAAAAEASPESLARATLQGPLAGLDGGEPRAVVTHLVSGPDLTLSFAESLRDAIAAAVPGKHVPDDHYVGVNVDHEEGADRRAVVLLLDE